MNSLTQGVVLTASGIIFYLSLKNNGTKIHINKKLDLDPSVTSSRNVSLNIPLQFSFSLSNTAKRTGKFYVHMILHLCDAG